MKRVAGEAGRGASGPRRAHRSGRTTWGRPLDAGDRGPAGAPGAEARTNAGFRVPHPTGGGTLEHLEHLEHLEATAHPGHGSAHRTPGIERIGASR